MRNQLARALGGAFVALLGSTASAQQRGSEIYLAPLGQSNGRPTIGTPVKIDAIDSTQSSPAFSNDGRALFFTTATGIRTSVVRYDLATKTSRRLPDTTSTQYDPSPVPGSERVSLLRVEVEPLKIGRRRLPRDVKRRVWTMMPDGSDETTVLPNLTMVLAHAWIDARSVLLVLPGRPPAIVRAEVVTGKLDTLARAAGALMVLPDRQTFAYVHEVDTSVVVTTFSLHAAPRDLVTLPPGARNAAWLSSNLLLASSSSKISYWSAATRTWVDAIDVSDNGISFVGGLAISPDRKWIAFVAYPPICPASSNSVFDAFAHEPTGFDLPGTVHASPRCFLPKGR